MRKILLLIFAGVLIFSSVSFADRNTATVTCYQTSQLVQRGEGKIYSITFVATANGGNFILLDAVSDTTVGYGGNGITDVKAEGSEATSANGSYQDFSDKPIECGTGIYLRITDGYVILRYE